MPVKRLSDSDAALYLPNLATSQASIPGSTPYRPGSRDGKAALTLIPERGASGEDSCHLGCSLPYE